MTLNTLIETSVSSFTEVSDLISGSYVPREQGYFPFELSRQFLSVAQRGVPNISEIYKETLQFLLNKFSTLSVIGKDNVIIPVNTIFGSPERSVAAQIQDDNLKLPIISITQIGDENDDERRRFRPHLNVETNWNEKTRRAERVLSLVPRPIKITYLINIWGEYLEDLDQIKEQVFSFFNPSMSVVTKFSNNTCAFLNELGDQSSFIVPDREDRLLKKQFEIVVESYIPTKKFLYTNTGEIREFVFDTQITAPSAFIANVDSADTETVGFSGLITTASGENGNGYGDISFFYVPENWQQSQKPLLLVFHAWNEDVYPDSGNTILANTTYLQEAQNRGWYLLAPNGMNGPTQPDIASRRNRGNVASFDTTRRTIRYLIDTYNIDPDRIFAVSFSHNAPAAQYAARYLDPADGIVCAAVVHSGGASARFMHYKDSGTPNELRFLAAGHGNPDFYPIAGSRWSEVASVIPEDRPFDYDQLSLISLDQTTSSYAYLTSSFGTNLKHVNMMFHILRDEPGGTQYLMSSTYMLWDYTANQKSYTNKTLSTNTGYTTHTWSSLDEGGACDFMASSVLALPSAGVYIADRDGRWLNFGIHKDASGWANFSFTISLAANQLTLFGLSNIDVFDVYMDDIGFNTSQHFKIFSSVKTRLFNWPSVPQTVSYQGNNVYRPFNWTFDPDNSILTLIPTDTDSIKTWIIN